MGYDDRRLEVAQAAWRVMIREGLDRTSMRAIAQELGSSTGVVTHYFRDKEELILFALEQVVEATLESMKACAKGQQGEFYRQPVSTDGVLHRYPAMLLAGKLGQMLSVVVL
jgi:AcrR family transcriptional regulator